MFFFLLVLLKRSHLIWNRVEWTANKETKIVINTRTNGLTAIIEYIYEMLPYENHIVLNECVSFERQELSMIPIACKYFIPSEGHASGKHQLNAIKIIISINVLNFDILSMWCCNFFFDLHSGSSFLAAAVIRSHICGLRDRIIFDECCTVFSWAKKKSSTKKKNRMEN